MAVTNELYDLRWRFSRPAPLLPTVQASLSPEQLVRKFPVAAGQSLGSARLVREFPELPNDDHDLPRTRSIRYLPTSMRSTRSEPSTRPKDPPSTFLTSAAISCRSQISQGRICAASGRGCARKHRARRRALRLLGVPRQLLAQAPREIVLDKEVLGENRNVLAPLAQGWHANRERAQAMEKSARKRRCIWRGQGFQLNITKSMS